MPQLIGAPYTNATWTTQMRSLGIPHTSFRTACFNPTISKFANQTACGVQTYVSLPQGPNHDHHDRNHDETFDPVFLGLSLLWTAKHLYTNESSTGEQDGFHWLSSGESGEYNIDLLAGGPLVRESIDAGLRPEEIKEKWKGGLEEFKEKREAYLLY